MGRGACGRGLATKGGPIMVVYVYDVSAAELAQVGGGYYLKLEGIEPTSFQWGVGRGITA